MGVIIWRGLGFCVPFFFAGAAWWMSQYYRDQTLGNLGLTGRVLLLTGGATLALALLTWKRNRNAEGGFRFYDNFFFVPLVILGPVLLGLGAWSLVAHNTGPSEEEWARSGLVELHLYNDGEKPLRAIVVDRGKLHLKETLGPGQAKTLFLHADSCLLGSRPEEGPGGITLPVDEAHAANKDKYERIEDEQGAFYQRKLHGGTLTHVDYDGAWFMLSGKYDYALVEVTSFCEAEDLKAHLAQGDWRQRVHKVLDGKDLVEPLFDERPAPGWSFELIGPDGKLLGAHCGDRDQVYILLPVPPGEPPSRELLARELEKRLP